ncbi:MAG TPA: DUF4389 domain-containing protein [Intrasporangium sp.]|uniref:DUF4389 domain-containing protein n=1 Tax=Intrasporangium sp. TaxID=1925024 RepID=UPI002D78C310|nr:DUF4389 domain-containing protein [Intrasporangium sp.]HET7398180.1 DUF4389 domain-containing protein [Intrasporangium sp.]
MSAPPVQSPAPPARRTAALVIGCLLLLLGVPLLLAGGALALGKAVAQDADGYFSMQLKPVDTPTVALTAEDVVLQQDVRGPRVVIDRLDLTIRVTTQSTNGRPVFVGVAPAADVDAYLGTVSHAVVSDVAEDGTASLRMVPGGSSVAPPTDQTFWSAQVSGAGRQQLTWNVTRGSWSVVVMNADASPGVAVETTVAVRPGFLGPLTWILLGSALLLVALGTFLLVYGVAGQRSGRPGAPGAPGTAYADSYPGTDAATLAPGRYPLRLEASLDPQLSRGLWLVKWLLAIPHYVVLVALWVAFGIVTVVAFFAILFTGNYPRSLFDFNVGVLRWTWRVAYYCGSGGLGTDRYPPFSLDADPDYPAALDVAYPERLSRGLVLVKWWLLAIPHYIIVGILAGGWSWTWRTGGDWRYQGGGAGLLGILALVVGLVLLFSGTYPRGLFDLVIGLNRWVYRVTAYAALMTDEYPPFRLDQGGAEPPPVASGPPPTGAPVSTAPPPPVLR